MVACTTISYMSKAKPMPAAMKMSHCLPARDEPRALSVASMLPRMANPEMKVLPET